MLVLSRTEGQTIKIGRDIVITVTDIAGCRVKIGIQSPKETLVLRGELKPLSKVDGAA